MNRNENTPEFDFWHRLASGEAYARASDPDTSQDSAEEVQGEKANRLEQVVVEALKNHPNGLTNHGLVAVTGIDWNTITPRIAPLKRKGLVIDSGQRREGPRNRPCIVWKAA
jgi:predicted transcriptional regulator